MHRSPFALFVFAFSLAAVADTPVSSIAYGPVASGTAHVLISDGRDYLALWDGPEGETGGLNATLVRYAGGPMPPIRIGSHRKVGEVAATWNGEEYVVAWTEWEKQEYPDPPYAFYAWIARISREGALLQVVEEPFSLNVRGPGSVEFVRGARNTVAWYCQQEIVVQQLDAAARAIDETILPRVYASAEHIFARGDSLVVFWKTPRYYPSGEGPFTLSMVTLDRHGNPLSDVLRLTDGETTSRSLEIAMRADRFVLSEVLWTKDETVLRTRLIDAGGGMTSLPDAPLAGASNVDLHCDADPCIAIASTDSRRAAALEIDLAHGSISDPKIVTDHRFSTSHMAWNGHAWLLLWAEDGYLGLLLTEKFDAHMNPLPGAAAERFALQPRAQSDVAVAAHGDHALIAWLDQDVVTVSAGYGDRWSAPWPVGPSDYKPVVVACGDDFVLFWQDGGLRTQRFSALGEPLGPMSVIPSVFLETVAFNGSTFLLALRSQSQVTAVRLDALGRMIDQQPFLVGGQSPVGNVSVASNGSDFLVGWYEDRGTFASRVASTGQVLDPVPMRLAASPLTVQVASDHRDYIVQFGIWFKRITPAGVLSDEMPERFDAVRIFSGEGRFLLTWKNGETVVIESRDTSLNLLQRETLPWSDLPALADPDGDHILAAVSRLTANSPLMPSRQIFAHMVEPDPPPARRRGSR